MEKVNLAEKLSTIKEYYDPHIAGELMILTGVFNRRRRRPSLWRRTRRRPRAP